MDCVRPIPTGWSQILRYLRLSSLAFLSLLATACSLSTMEAPISGFRPIEPRQEFSTDYNSLLEEVVWSLNPVLVWEPFPGTHQDFGLTSERPFIDVDPARVRNLRYELRIWRAVNGYPGRLVYEARDLRQAQHQVRQTLQRKTHYFWSVRARFRVDGMTRVTEWSIATLPHHGGAPARRVARNAGTIPPQNYYRFRTF